MRFKRWMALPATGALLGLLVFAQPAAAQTPTPTPQGCSAGCPQGNQAGGRMMNGRGVVSDEWHSMLDLVAGALKIDRATLLARLDGVSVADVAKARGVSLDTIVNAIMAPRAARIEARVTAGTLTRAQADTMLALMRSQISERLSQPWAPRTPPSGAGTCTQPGFTDTDGDGVCDYRTARPGMSRVGRGRH